MARLAERAVKPSIAESNAATGAMVLTSVPTVDHQRSGSPTPLIEVSWKATERQGAGPGDLCGISSTVAMDGAVDSQAPDSIRTHIAVGSLPQ